MKKCAQINQREGMLYSVKPVTQSSQHEIFHFLKEHENYALFLLANFRTATLNIDIRKMW